MAQSVKIRQKSPYHIVYSVTDDRDDAAELPGSEANIPASFYVFLADDDLGTPVSSGITSVTWYKTGEGFPTTAGTVRSVAPFDLEGTSGGLPVATDRNALDAGVNTLWAVISAADGSTYTISSQFSTLTDAGDVAFPSDIGLSVAIPTPTITTSPEVATTSISLAARVPTPTISVSSSGALGEAGMKTRFGWNEIGDGATARSRFEAIETEMGRDILFWSHNLGFQFAGSDYLGQAKAISTDYAIAWQSRPDVTLCVICPLISADVRNPGAAYRITHLTKTKNGDYDSSFNQICAAFSDRGMQSRVRFRLGHESDIYPGNPSAKWLETYTATEEALWRDAFDHVAAIIQSHGIAVDYPGAPEWYKQARTYVPNFPQTNTDLACEWAEPSSGSIDGFGGDIYGLGGGKGQTQTSCLTYLTNSKNNAATRSVGFVIPEYGIWAHKADGTRTSTTDAQATAFMTAWFDQIATYPLSGPGTCLYFNYFPWGPIGGQPDSTRLSKWFPSTWEYVKSRMA